MSIFTCKSFMCRPKNTYVDKNNKVKLIVNRDEVSKYHLLVCPLKHSENFSDLGKDD